MELRSNKTQELIKVLKAAGVYEDDMEIEEMRQVALAMELSAESNDAVESCDLERALLESEIDFQLMVNSTMIVDPAPTSSSESMEVFNGADFDRDCESPPSNPVHFEVRAVVHHELNWSPTCAVRPPKRQASDTACETSTKRRQNSEFIERQSESNAEAMSLNNGDSGVSCNDEIGTLSSISEHSTMPSIGEMPSRLLISTSSAAVSEFSDHNQSSP
ncbi:uncharacterized protein LOC117780382 [Drosophila innubila]|uniref:uncharacterized protein LOC117780382 n=1 Tax=Drosophila innubila TaxID=198719 RepID=UPI00148E3214|nr:uncharacterized protein LOC117780382 [Drosophila innubila]